MRRYFFTIYSVLFAGLLIATVGCSDDVGEESPNAADGDVGADALGFDVGADDAGADTDDGEDDAGEHNATNHAEACEADTCSGNGECIETDDGVVCECDEGYVGAECETCDEDNGYQSDGLGACLLSLCDPDPCDGDPDRECVVENGQASCECSGGLIEKDGACVPATTCGPTTCNGNGTCSDDGGGVSCECDPGYTDAFCSSCDEVNGYHSDGEGGCTDDPCLPNPCTESNRSVCVDLGDEQTHCECDPGYHLAGGVCVQDEECQADSCGDSGSCDDSSGVVQCTCDEGYTGDFCEECHEAAGYYDDGEGGCSDDPCLHDPCTEPNQSQCSPDSNTSSGYVCSCDDGYHDDGVGGCTDDPCTPNPCAAENQACQPIGDDYECYTPDCDDGNPCTEGELIDGECDYVDLNDGTPCSTTLCTQDQSCNAGQCTGGSEVVCDDDNPCTQASCDPDIGCEYEADNSLIPDDGIACTIGSCQDGTATYSPDDDYCDDDLWCTGSAVCEPDAAESDADGCLTTDVPIAPGHLNSPCAHYGECDEATQSFPLVMESSGTSCDDGIACTTGSQCDGTGACVGTINDDCGFQSCTETTGPSSTVDIPSAWVTGEVTLDGQAFPEESRGSHNLRFWLRAHDTGRLHRIHLIDFGFQSGSPYYVRTNSAQFETVVVAGVYDLVYTRGLDSDDNVITPYDDEVIPYANRVLQESIVVGPGINELDIDLQSSQVSGTVTVDGEAFPEESPRSYDVQLWLRAHDTGKRHRLHRLQYSFQSDSPDYLLSSSTDFDTIMSPGTYDLIYERALDNSGDPLLPHDDEVTPNGYRVLQTDIDVVPGANSLNIDVPTGRVSGTVTLDGAELPEESARSYDQSFRLRAHDTGRLHRIHQISYSFQSGSPTYARTSPDDFDTMVPPGDYDLVYIRALNSNDNVWTPHDDEEIPHGHRVLQQDINVGTDTTELDIDLQSAHATGTVTLDGQTLPEESPRSHDMHFWLRAHDTGTLHGLHTINFSFQSGSPDYLRTTSAEFETLMPPGNYDLIYARGHTSSGEVIEPHDEEVIPFGFRVLQEDIDLSPGSNDLDIDISTAHLSGTVTLDGQTLPEESPRSHDMHFWLRAHDTGWLHRLVSISYSFQSDSPDYVRTDETDFEALLPPGDYDLIYTRGLDNNDDVLKPHDDEVIPFAHRVLQHDLTVSSGSNSQNIDLSSTHLSSTTTLDGGTMPETSPRSYDLEFWLRARDTERLHRVHRIRYSFQSGSPDYLRTSDADFETLVPPGVYDLIYSRALDNNGNALLPHDDEAIPHAFRALQMCVEVP